jgi:hypothetical protein
LDPFALQLSAWNAFYSAVASASATLVGLLFVSLSINRKRITSATEPELLLLARRSCGDLLYVLLISLVILVPNQHTYGLGVALLTLGVTRGCELLGELIGQTRRGAVNVSRPPAPQILRVFGLPLLSSVGLVIVSLGIYFDYPAALYLLVPVIAALIGRASWNAWLLLVLEDAAPSDAGSL